MDALHRAHVPVDEDSNEERVDSGNGSGFRWREHAAIDPADDDDDQEQAPSGFLAAIENFLEPFPGLSREIAAARDEIDRTHQHETGNKTRNNAREEHAANRDVGCCRIDHHHDGWRNEDTERTGIGDDTGCKFLGIANLPHTRDGDRSDGDNCRRR